MIESGYSDEEIKDRSGFLEGEGPTISTGSVKVLVHILNLIKLL